MSSNAQIISIEDNNIQVVPLIKDACISCSKTTCAKKGSPYSVVNKNNLPIKVGDIVEISASKKRQAIQVLIALIMPILIAILFYFLSFPFAKITHINISEELQIVFVLLGLCISATIVCLFNKKNTKLQKSEITSIID